MAVVMASRPKAGPGYNKRQDTHDELARLTGPFVGRRATLKGFRGAREVYLREGYVADAVYVAAFQNAWCHKYGKVMDTGREKTAFERLVLDSDEEIPLSDSVTEALYEDYIHQTRAPETIAVLDDMVLVFEAKRTKSDFLATFSDKNFKERATPAGDLHWVVTPKGLVGKEEVPAFWGLLEECGGGLREKKKPLIQDFPKESRYAVEHTLLWKKSYHRDFYVLPSDKRGTADVA